MNNSQLDELQNQANETCLKHSMNLEEGTFTVILNSDAQFTFSDYLQATWFMFGITVPDSYKMDWD